MTPVDAPLQGLHIVDLSSFVAGPSCTMTLAQLGARVLRIDPPQGPVDEHRHPLAPDGSSLYWAGLNKGKAVTRLDLRSEEGQTVVHRLLALPGADHGLLVTNAVGQRWLDYERLTRVRPDLIMVHIEGRADGGSAVDYTINCETGLPDLTGPTPIADPINSVLPSWDLLTGLHASVSLLAAHAHRRRTGTGTLIRISLADVAAATMANLGYVADSVVNESRRVREGNSLYGTYGQDFALADGRRVMVVALTRRQWLGLVAMTGIAEPIRALEGFHKTSFDDEGARYTHRAQITALLAPWFDTGTHAQVSAALDEAHVPWGNYRSTAEMATATDGLVASSSIFDSSHHPGIGTYPVPRAVARATSWTPPPTPPPVSVAPHEALRTWTSIETGTP